MKRIKICLLLFLSMAVVLTGCAGISGYLKTTQTIDSVATFFNNNYLKGIDTFQNVANDSTVLYTETERVAYRNYTNFLYDLMPQERCLVATVDYLYEINNSQNASTQKVKLKPYEFSVVLKAELELLPTTSVYAENYANVKAVVLLERADKTTSLEVNTYLFYMDASTSYEVSDLQNNTQNANYQFTFVQTGYNVQTKTFSLKYNTTCTATASFNQEKGYLSYTMNTLYGQNNSAIKLEKYVYEYAGGTCGIRVLTEYGTGGQNTLSIYEQMTAPFYKRLKVGEVKDKTNILSLDTMPEDKLGVSNSSDKSGYQLVLDSRDDTELARIVCESYGLSQ